MKIAIIVPAYNEERVIGKVVSGLKNEYSGVDIIVVDDGSTDNTASLAEETGVKVLKHYANLGYGAALKSGVHHSDAELILFFDGDGQHDPKDVRRLIDAIKDCDMVVGARSRESHIPLFRRPGKWLLGFIANRISGHRIPDLNSGLRAIRREVFLKYVHLLPNGFSLSTTLTFAFLKAGRIIRYIPIVVNKREGKSSVNQVTHGTHALLLMLKMVVLFNPLRIFIPSAILLFGGGAVYAVLQVYVFGAPAGIADTTVLLCLSGLLTFFFGLLTDQVSSMRREKHE
jgi:glycosyltransferase involved in cell wall biosynthesis